MPEPLDEPRSTPLGAERETTRTVTFSDAVIAVAIAPLVLEIRPTAETHDLVRSLLTLRPSYPSYGSPSC